MPNPNAMQIKERVISLLKMNGPSLPVHIAKGTGQSILFASAFLSELFYEKKIIISKIKVGNSPLYFLPGQEPQLERFYTYLNSKEKEAFLLLKDKKFLRDSEQQPAIRVALREIKDFAIPFKNEEDIYWRYFTVPEQEIEEAFNKKERREKREEVEEVEEIIPEEKEEQEESEKEKEESEEEEEGEAEEEEEKIQEKEPEKLNIFEKENKKPRKKKIVKKKSSQKQDDNFFNKVKEFLSKEGIEIIDIQSFNKNDLILKVKEKKEEKLLIAYNKKRVTEEDLMKAYSKSLEENLPYIVLSLGDSAKKLRSLILAVKNLSRIEKIE
jgi:hypothetical protein